jgi:PqqD family protein of HPr-rel-A system
VRRRQTPQAPGQRISTTWRVISKIDLRWKFFHGQYVVYNGHSGHTHVLDPVAALLVQVLTDDSCETGELAKRLGALLKVDVTESFCVKLDETLSQLDDVGLIEPVTS